MRSSRRRCHSIKEVGVISDTHGLLRPEALDALRGCDVIVHAGDIGEAEILRRLHEIAPTQAVRGNNDRGAWAQSIPLTQVIDLGGPRLYMLHDLSGLDIDPAAEGFAAVVSGHSHKPHAERREGVLYLNPGSAGPRRFRLPIAVAKLYVRGDDLQHELIELRV
jgi:putative phosphoesterase